jgi:hypothetical protein
MRLGNALLGATPANPANTACINGRPCAASSEALWTRRVSVRDDLLISVVYKSMSNQIKIEHRRRDQFTRKLQAATREYLSCTESVLMAHCRRASSKPGGRV